MEKRLTFRTWHSVNFLFRVTEVKQYLTWLLYHLHCKDRQSNVKRWYTVHFKAKEPTCKASTTFQWHCVGELSVKSLSHPTLNLASDQVRNVVSVKIDHFVRFLPTLKYFIEPILNVYIFAPMSRTLSSLSILAHAHPSQCPFTVEGNSLFKTANFTPTSCRPVSSIGRASDYSAVRQEFESQAGPTLRILK